MLMIKAAAAAAAATTESLLTYIDFRTNKVEKNVQEFSYIWIN
jgi:hypothetical protein